MNQAAFECGVPATTIKDRVSGRVTRGCKMGAKPYFMKEELVDFLLQYSKMGYGRTRQEEIA